MPRRHWKLSAREELEYAARAHELREMGVPIEVPDPPQAAVDLQVACGGNFIFNSSPLNMILVIEVSMLARRSDICMCDELSVILPWSGPVFEIGYDLGRSAEPYRISANLAYDRDQVLNERLFMGMRLQKGKIVSGLLVLLGQGQLPAAYRNGKPINVEISLFDSLGGEFKAQAVTLVNRNLELSREKCEKQRTKASSLCEPLPPKSAVKVSHQTPDEWFAEMKRLTASSNRMYERAKKMGTLAPEFQAIELGLSGVQSDD